MSDVVTMDALVALIGKSTLIPTLASEGPDDLLCVWPTSLQNYVPPNLMGTDADRLAKATVILITAPAAVGKTTLGREVSTRTQSLYWDLSKYSVGSGFFTGTIVDNFGPEQFAKYRAAIRDGSVTMVLDAADEALVRAGAQGFEAAVRDLAQLLGREPKRSPSIVLLGRPDTIADVEEWLIAQDITSARLVVDFFDEDQARSYISKKAALAGANPIPEFDLFLNVLFENVRDGLHAATWNEAKNFLGYAPVLGAIAAFYSSELASTNPLRRLNELNRQDDANHVWQLLVNLINEILVREAGKFGQAFGAGDDAKAAYGEEAYGPLAQCRLLLSDESAVEHIDLPDPVGADATWLDEIVPQIKNQLRDHPFLAQHRDPSNPLNNFTNVAFRDFVVAFLICSGEVSAIEDVAILWDDPKVNPSPILARFVLSSSLRPRWIPSSFIAVLADSHSSEKSRGTRLFIDAYDAEDEPYYADQGINLIGFVSFVANTSSTDLVSFDLTIAREMRFARSLANAYVFSETVPVTLGLGMRDFGIGPNVEILSPEIRSEALELRVRSESGMGAQLETAKIGGSTQRVSARPAEALVIRTPATGHPWQRFRVGQTGPLATDSLDQRLSEAGRALRRNLSWFTRPSMVAGGLTYPASKFETILNKGRASSEMHTFMVERGYATLVEGSVRVALPGFSVPVARLHDTTNDAYVEFLTSFLEWLVNRPKGQ